jgi:hypothetical protein
MDNTGDIEELKKLVAINLDPNITSVVTRMAEEQDKDQIKNQTYDEIVVLLEQIMNDRTVPKNIRKAAEDSKAILQGTDSAEVKISTAISILDEITNDPNMPMYTRTQIWNAVSMLEQKRREFQ